MLPRPPAYPPTHPCAPQLILSGDFHQLPPVAKGKDAAAQVGLGSCGCWLACWTVQHCGLV